MENQIAIINPSELESVIKNSGLELVEGEQIKISYQPFLSQLAEIHEQASKIDFQNPKELDERIAGDLRKKTVKIRTGAAELKDSRKRIHLLKGNLEQACFNLIKTSCELTEETFVKVEKAREIAEKARKEQLRIERSQKLLQYCDNVSIYPLGEFTDQQFDDLFNGFKSTYEQKIEAEKQAELARIEKEKKEKLFNSRVNELAPYARFFVDLKITELCTETTENEFITMKTLCVNASSEYDKKQEHIRAENEKLKKKPN